MEWYRIVTRVYGYGYGYGSAGLGERKIKRPRGAIRGTKYLMTIIYDMTWHGSSYMIVGNFCIRIYCSKVQCCYNYVILFIFGSTYITCTSYRATCWGPDVYVDGIRSSSRVEYSIQIPTQVPGGVYRGRDAWALNVNVHDERLQENTGWYRYPLVLVLTHSDFFSFFFFVVIVWI